MSDKYKTTDASKVELTDEQLDDAQGGAVSIFMKIDDIPGESAKAPSAGAKSIRKIGDLKGEVLGKSNALDKSYKL